MKTMIQDMLHSLAITGNYKGYWYAIIACSLIFEDKSRLYSIMNDIYPNVAKEFNCSVPTVERNIRTIIFRAWKYRRERLNEIAGYPLSAPPSVSEFLAMLTMRAQ